MRPIRLTNRELQEILQNMRTQLKHERSATGTVSVTYKLTPISSDDKAHITLTEQAWEKIKQLVDQCDKEVGWHGTVERTSKNEFTITDILVFPQTVTAATVTSDETKYTMWLMSQPDEVFNKLRFHGHSHVNMGVSPSAVDTKYQDDILKNLNDFYIFGIFNKREDNYLIIYDVTNNIVYEDKDIILHTPSGSYRQWAKEMLEEHVSSVGYGGKTTSAAPKKKAEAKPKYKSYVDELLEDMEDDRDTPPSYYDWRQRIYGMKAGE